jgi:hypothetical protein
MKTERYIEGCVCVCEREREREKEKGGKEGGGMYSDLDISSNCC